MTKYTPSMITFDQLTPDLVTDAVESATDISLTALVTPLPSYINRVYELETDDGDRLVAKFYRPGRWSISALLEEHTFVRSCETQGIPVVAPMEFAPNVTLASAEGIPFAVFPKKAGRLFELKSDEDYIRSGALIGRIHNAGEDLKADERRVLTPESSLAQDLHDLTSGDLIPEPQRSSFIKVTAEIATLITPLFENEPLIPVHGDCHTGNILDRGIEGLQIIDFDDMAVGPAIHDLWLLLPGPHSESVKELNLLLEGYETFRPISFTSRRLIEPLRAMRIIYFLAWCARQKDDFQFQNHFPLWGSPVFWEKEIQDLENQKIQIQTALDTFGGP